MVIPGIEGLSVKINNPNVTIDILCHSSNMERELVTRK